MGRDDKQAAQDARRRKAEEKRKASENAYQWRGFVNVSVDESWRSTFDAWVLDDDLTSGALFDIVEMVGKVSLSYDGKQGCYLAALTVTAEGRPDRGLCVTARSTDLFKALWRVVFIYWQVCAGNLETHFSGPSRGYDDTQW